MLNDSVLIPASLQPPVCRLVSWHCMPHMIYLIIWKEPLQRTEDDLADLWWWKFSSGAARESYLNKFLQRTSKTVVWSLESFFLCVCTCACIVCIYQQLHVYFDLLICRCMEQPSSSMSLTQRRTCLSVSAHSLAFQAPIWDLTGPEVFTATRASVCSPIGPSSSPSRAFSLSSTDTPSPDHMLCPLKS